MNDNAKNVPAPATRHFSAFADMERFFDRALRNWPFSWAESGKSEPRALRVFEHVPNVEVKENGNAYSVTVELPGLDDKDVKVSIEDDMLTITGEKKVERTDEKTHYSERSYGSFTRSFSLPADADGGAVAARFAKGVLSIDIPKTAKPRSLGKEVPIKAS